MFIAGNEQSAVAPPNYYGNGMQGYSHGIGELGAMAELGYLGQLYGQLGNLHAAMTAEERKAKAAAAEAERAQKRAEAHAKQIDAAAQRQATAQEKAGQRQAAQQTRQAAAAQAAAARQAAQQANRVKVQQTQQANKAAQVAKQAEAKAKQVKAVADRKAKAAALKQNRIAGKTVTANEKDSALINKVTPQINDAQNTIQNALTLAKKALQTRNQNDKIAAVNAAKTAGQKINSIMGSTGTGVRGMGRFGDIVQDPNTGQYIDTNTGQIVDQTAIGGGAGFGPPAYNYGPPPPSLFGGGIDQTGLLLGSAFQPIQTPAQCQRNPNKPVCVQFQMQQQTQQQMQMVFSLLQNMFAQLMDIINQLLQQNFATQAGGVYAGGIPPPGYGTPPYDPYGGAYGAPYGSPYGSPYAPAGGDVQPIPPGYDYSGGGAVDPYGGVPQDINPSYTSAGPGAGVGPYGAPPPQYPQSPFPDQNANLINPDVLPVGADQSGDIFSAWFGESGDASAIAPPSIFTASTAYGLPPPPQYALAPTIPQQPTVMPQSNSVSQGPGAQMVAAQTGPIYQQSQPIYDDGSGYGQIPLYSDQPMQTFPVGPDDQAPDGTPQYAVDSLFNKLQLPGPGQADELVIGDEDGSEFS